MATRRPRSIGQPFASVAMAPKTVNKRRTQPRGFIFGILLRQRSIMEMMTRNAPRIRPTHFRMIGNVTSSATL